ncbi:MAG: hypothetical protein OXG08_12375 [Gammaproteobacteria bacterium]|nr:hypothetical protein [Gammaproteobacteria bacterium]
MNTNITVRGIDPADKTWLRRYSQQLGVSMEELVRRLIHEKRRKTECHPKPSEAFALFFGKEHGIESLPSARYGYRPISSSGESEI